MGLDGAGGPDGRGSKQRWGSPIQRQCDDETTAGCMRRMRADVRIFLASLI